MSVQYVQYQIEFVEHFYIYYNKLKTIQHYEVSYKI